MNSVLHCDFNKNIMTMPNFCQFIKHNNRYCFKNDFNVQAINLFIYKNHKTLQELGN